MWFPIVFVGVWQLFRKTLKENLSANRKMRAPCYVCAELLGQGRAEGLTMGDNAEAPEDKAGEPKPPKTKAEENPWYLLATLYGVPKLGHYNPRAEELQEKNQIAWNRYFTANFGEATRTRLIEDKRHSAEELTPFSPEESQVIAMAFALRCEASGKKLALPSYELRVDFSNVEFEQNASFVGYLFCNASCDGATFSGWADFGDAFFQEGTTFCGVTFSKWAVFRRATFYGETFFKGAKFFGAAYFDRAIFNGGAHFDGVTCCNRSSFFGVSFLIAFFKGATFSRETFFNGATFSHFTYFDGTTFSDDADFSGAGFHNSSTFVNAEMKGETSFEGAVFEREPPHFFGAKLHQGTVWRGIDWPTPKVAKEAGRFIDAYACLKLEMDRLKKHEDELNFFAHELKSRRVEQGTWAGLPIAIYGAFSDYGRSYLRPLVALFYLALICALAFLTLDSLSPWQSLGLSAANTLNVFGFRKDFFEPAVIARLPAWLEVFSALQTILGTVLLFLFGLGIRNKFRIK